MNNCYDKNRNSQRTDVACAITIPTNVENYDDIPFRGSWQQLLFLNIGRLATIEFLEDSHTLRSVTGIIETVGVKYVVLKNVNTFIRTVGDVFNIRFVTFHCN